MKSITTLIFSLLVLFAVLLGGCVATAPTPTKACPSENVVIFSPWDESPILLEEGFLDHPDVITEEEFLKMYEEEVKRHFGI